MAIVKQDKNRAVVCDIQWKKKHKKKKYSLIRNDK